MPARILVIDDDRDTLKLLKLMLENAGYEPMLAENGQVALTMVDEIAPDLVLCDILMPCVDGYATLVGLRANLRTACVPVLMLSALGHERDVQAAMDAGANGYVVKPFAMRPLLSLIKEHLVAATSG